MKFEFDRESLCIIVAVVCACVLLTKVVGCAQESRLFDNTNATAAK